MSQLPGSTQAGRDPDWSGEIESRYRIGDVSGLIPPDQLREMLSRINHQLDGNKALRNDWPLRVRAMDGHEFSPADIVVFPNVRLGPSRSKEK